MKNIIIRIGAGALLLSILAPLGTFAQTTAPAPNRATSTRAMSCTAITDRITKLDAGLSERMNGLVKARAQQDTNVAERVRKEQEALAKWRTGRDAELRAHVAKLNEKATTDGMKQAVLNFQTAVQAALSARRAAVDQALATFHSGVDTLRDTRRKAMDDAITAAKAAKDAAIAKAKADCAAGVPAATVRQTLITALRAAQKTIVDAAKKAEGGFALGTKDQFDTLKASLKSAMDKANADFKAALEKARIDLKTALGPSANTTSTTTN